MNIKSANDLVNKALLEIKTISVDEALALSNEGKCNIIDIREKGELDKTGRVKNSNHIPRGMLEFWLDPESPYFKSDLKVEMVKILYCASNWRSALASKALMEMGFTNVMHIQGGFQSLVDAGFSVQKVEPK